MIVHRCLQGSDEWLWLRLGCPTASEFGRIIQPSTGKPSKAKTVEAYIAELIAEQVCPPRPDEQFQSRAMWEGTNIEAEARAYMALETGVDYEEVGFVTDDGERYGCSPDGLADDCGLELKGPEAKKHVGYMLDPSSLLADYKCQVHGGMVVCERERWIIASYCPPFEPVVVPVEWDKFTDALRDALAEFSDKYKKARAVFEQANGGMIVKPPRPRVKHVDEPIWM